MTKQQLSQLRYLRQEIALLKNQIASAEPQMTHDKVKGSMTEFPYILQDIKVYGVDIAGYETRQKIRKDRLRRRLAELEKLVEELESFIAGIEDSLTRQILILRYIEGLNWAGVATKIGGGNTPDSVRMMHNRFFLGK